MAAFTLGEATAMALGRMKPRSSALPPSARRASAPVRRDSLEAGSFETAFFQVPAKGETDRLLRLARAALDAGRRLKREARAEERGLSAAERTLAAMTAGAVRIYEEICTLARINEGRVFPSYDWLAKATALGRATGARALQVLEDAGFLARQRRFKRVEGEGPGPRWKQTSNVYRPLAPARLMGLLPRWLRSAPVSADVTQRFVDEAAEQVRLRGQLSCCDLAKATVGGMLGRALAKLGKSLDQQFERESQSDAQPHQRLLIK